MPDFDDETKQAFIELYDKVDVDFEMPSENVTKLVFRGQYSLSQNSLSQRAYEDSIDNTQPF